MGTPAEEWLDALPHPALVIDSELRVVRHNPALGSLTGGNVAGQLLRDILPWAQPSFEMTLRLALESSQTMGGVELPAPAPDGRHFRLTCFPIGTGMGLMLAETSATSVQAREQERVFHQIFDNAAVGILVFDWQGQGLWVNRAFCRLLGYEQAELARMGVANISHPEDFAKDVALMQQMMAGEISHYDLAKRYIRKDGSMLWGHLNVSLSRDEAGKPKLVIGMLEDVSEDHRHQEEREGLIAQLEQALRARDIFLAIASHELKTPLTSLQLGLQTLSHRASKAGEPPSRELDSALRQIGKLTALIDDLLDVSRIRNGQLTLHVEPFDLAAAVRELGERYAPLAERAGSPLSTSGVTPPQLVQADRPRIERIITNFLSNAIKFGAGKPIEVSVHGAPERVQVSVQDHGAGIAAADQARIFQPFERAVSELRYGGLGLGLYIARFLAEAHGGQVGLVSQPGAGACFTLELPRNSVLQSPGGDAGRAASTGSPPP